MIPIQIDRKLILDEFFQKEKKEKYKGNNLIFQNKKPDNKSLFYKK